MKDFWCDTVYRMKDPLHIESYAIINKGNLRIGEIMTNR